LQIYKEQPAAANEEEPEIASEIKWKREQDGDMESSGRLIKLQPGEDSNAKPLI